MCNIRHDTAVSLPSEAQPWLTVHMLRDHEEWQELVSDLTSAERAAVEKVLEAYSEGYMYHSRRGRALSDYLTSSEFRSWRRACDRSPGIRGVLISLWQYREEMRPRPKLRGLEIIYRKLMQDAPQHRAGLSELLAHCTGSLADVKPEGPSEEARAAHTWVVGQVRRHTDAEFATYAGISETKHATEALCLFYLDLYVFTALWELRAREEE